MLHQGILSRTTTSPDYSCRPEQAQRSSGMNRRYDGHCEETRIAGTAQTQSTEIALCLQSEERTANIVPAEAAFARSGLQILMKVSHCEHRAVTEAERIWIAAMSELDYVARNAMWEFPSGCG